MEWSETVPAALLARRARRAYEIGRLRFAVGRAWPVPVVGAAACTGCGPAGETLAALAALALLAVGLRWRGGVAGSGVNPGLLAGLLPLALPMGVVRLGGFCPGGSGLAVCLAACAAGGLLASLLLGWRALSLDAGRPLFLICSGAVAACAGAAGCAVAGMPGIAAMAAGLAAGAAPAVALGRLAAR
ncbi:MAG TPA: hypothetical protein VJV23_12725 [Candidatus Polarisedimenticolia bacterium]|nr:hypothetical protein [Candidatus Polarisedimenticolia bacterium]